MTNDRAAYRQLSADALDDLARTGQPSAMYQRELAAAVLALTGEVPVTRNEVAFEIERDCPHAMQYLTACITCRETADRIRGGSDG